MCLYEPINGDYPTVKFCNEYITCKSCPYHYDEDVKKENKNASENL